MPTEKVPASDDPKTGVRAKDIVISPETGLSARIFIPKTHNPLKKFPVLIYTHGGGFSIGSAFIEGYTNLVRSLAADANMIAVSVEYRLAPEHPLPTCYEDTWEAVKWVASHANGHGPESWLNHRADFGRVFLAGDSAGANIAHNMAARVGSHDLPGVKIRGLALVHPFFGGTEDDKMWFFICPSNSGPNDPRLKPTLDDLSRLGCEKVLIFVAGNDHLRERGTSYFEELKRSGWKGTVEIEETEGEDHVFHLLKPDCENAVALHKRLIAFLSDH